MQTYTQGRRRARGPVSGGIEVLSVRKAETGFQLHGVTSIAEITPVAHSVANDGDMSNVHYENAAKLACSSAQGPTPANAIGMTRNCYTRVGDPTDWIGTAWDVDYGWRVQLAGMKLTYVAEALVHYRLRDTAEGRFKQARTWGRGHVKLHIRYGMKPWWRYLAFSLYRLVRAGFLLVFGTLAGKRPYAYWVFDWYYLIG